MSPSQSLKKTRPAWDVYQEQLFSLEHGLPLWDPEPLPDYSQVLSWGSVIYPADELGGAYITLFHSAKGDSEEAKLPRDYVKFEAPPVTLTSIQTIKTPLLYSKAMSFKKIETSAHAAA